MHCLLCRPVSFGFWIFKMEFHSDSSIIVFFWCWWTGFNAVSLVNGLKR
jgi:hypothetical protein